MYVRMQPIMIKLLRYGLDILMFLHTQKRWEQQISERMCEEVTRYELLVPVLDVHGKEDTGEDDTADCEDGDHDEESEGDA